MPKNKKAILLLSVLVLTLSFGFFTPNHSTRAQGLFEGKIFAFYNVYTALPGTNVSDFTAWWRSEGGGAKNITDLTAETLEGVNCLILNCPDADQDESGHGITNFTMAQAEAVRDWFLNTTTGHHFLWSSSDSSFTYAGFADAYRSNNATMILEVLGSKLRYEPSSVEDPDYNAAAVYRPILNTTSDDPVVANCTEGITDVVAHSPTLLYGMDGTTPVALETTTLANVYPILMTGAGGMLNDPTPLDPMYAHTNGQQDNFVMVAAELGIGGTTHRLVASGGAPIGGYNPMFLDVSKGIPLTGSQFIKQTVIWGMEEPATIQPPPLPMELIIAAVAVVVVVVVIAIVYLLMKRR